MLGDVRRHVGIFGKLLPGRRAVAGEYSQLRVVLIASVFKRLSMVNADEYVHRLRTPHAASGSIALVINLWLSRFRSRAMKCQMPW